MVSRWVNNHQQPSDFYRDLLARTLGRPRAELFSDEAARLELAAEAEPWLLARVLEASSVGQAALEALEQAVGEFARSYPSTARPSSPVRSWSTSGTSLGSWTAPCRWPAASDSRWSPSTWPGWPAAWRSTCPLTGQALTDAQATVAGWDDPASPQGGPGGLLALRRPGRPAPRPSRPGHPAQPRR
jgi:hypothetical protein